MSKRKQVRASARTSRSSCSSVKSVEFQVAIDWLTVSWYCSIHGKADEAFEALEHHSTHKTKDATYFYRLVQAHEANGNDSEALEAFKEYIRLSGIIGEKIITQDTRFVEERQHHINQYEKAEERTTIQILSIAVSMLALLLSFLTIIAIRKQLQIEKTNT